MKQLLDIFLLGLLFAAPASVLAKVSIFACEPEWAALAEEIGGKLVDIKSATHARQDPHHIRARPSLIAKIRNADLLLCSGAGLEAGWLPILLQKAGKQVQPGSTGYLMVADIVPLLEKPVTVDRSMGDVHPEGNPHVHTNPHNILQVAKELNKRLQSINAEHATHYQANYDRFADRWKKAITRWEKQAAPLKGKYIVAHHRSWSYLIDWLRLELVDTLELKPGIPPTTSHLEQLLANVRNKSVIAIIRTPYEPGDASIWLSNKSNVPALVLPYTVGGSNTATDLFTLFQETINHLNEVARD